MKIDKISDLRIMVIGAHPDDPDLNFGGTAIKFAQAGARVRFVSFCNGSKGHRVLSEADLAARRFGEMQRSAAVLGIEKYETLGCPDCELEPTMEWRKRLTKVIREFAPDLVFSHRTCDYHADYRACGTLMMDLAYFLRVPLWCPEVPEPPKTPAVFFLRDKFTMPRELRPDVVVDATPVMEQKLDALINHESQFFEWLPPEIAGAAEANPGADGTPEAKRAFVKRFWMNRLSFDAKRFNLPFEYPESFELSEYGAQPSSEELKDLFPAGSIVRDRAAGGMR